MTPEQIRAARRQLGLNQTDMAKLLLTPRSTYVKWERGERKIKGSAVVAVAGLLEKDRQFMARFGPPTGPTSR